MACKLTSTPGQQSRTEVPSSPALTVQAHSTLWILPTTLVSCIPRWGLDAHICPGSIKESKPIHARQEAAAGGCPRALLPPASPEASQRGKDRAWNKAPITTPTRKKQEAGRQTTLIFQQKPLRFL